MASRPSKSSRRAFLKQSSAAAAAVAAGALRVPHVFAAAPPGDKLRCAVIGCGGRGTDAHIPNALSERLVALVDPDPARTRAALNGASRRGGAGFDASAVKTFTDYR